MKRFVDELGPLACAGTVAEAIEFSVVPYTAMEQIGKAMDRIPASERTRERLKA